MSALFPVSHPPKNHGQMYSGTSASDNDCTANNASALTAANQPAFINTDSADGTPSKFVVNYPAGSPLFSCVAADTQEGLTNYRTFGFANEATSVLTARYAQPCNNEPDSQTDIFQVYLSFVAGSEMAIPGFLAFNHPSAAGARAIVLTNLVDHKFAVKYRWGQKQIVAVGVGGVDATSGAPVTGHYVARVVDIDNGNPSDNGVYCVDNAAGTYTTHSGGDCGTDTTLGTAWNTMTSDTVATFLGMSDVDKDAAVNYLAFFASNETVFDQVAGESPRDGVSTETCTGSGTYPCYAENKKDFPNLIQ